ncbi:asparagine synthase-related protein [Cellulomonas marina]|uniref:asparagine synthase (glutamine-hydrolyzing) n=1 Tax=Cellulomonas marina TaxID=988821 RepID=A0A1I1AA48_9CELL|nr:asparagine synthase-related protein [Cellulomonas marina]GIG30394.1 hypothetical protein Cma02nite_29940 [Cellulomonas marina]SFB34849.1 asparagine synthase (glutamine-hydrolysing) [Cellulomonas marina]
MCGVCGEVTADGSRADAAAVARMCEAQAPRGPDGAGSWSEGPVALGHRRLAVIDTSDAGAKPWVDDDLGLALVFNGCVYNYRELRERLRGHGYRFRSACDTEVVLAAYHRWGTGFVEHLVGMFAVVVLERGTGRVVLARDRLGVKPLYLSLTARRLRFASTLPALLAGGDVDTTIDRVGLHHYLTWRAVGPAPRTLLRGVEKLPPATVRVVEPDGTTRDHRYWSPSYERRAEHAGWTAEDWTDAVQDALTTAVRRRMVADVPVGVLLVELAAACPPELKLAEGGKGVLRAVARRLVPAEVIDRPKGYIPVPAVTHLDGPVLDLVRDALTSTAAKERGLFRPEHLDPLLERPDEGRSPTGVNRLWPLGLLELWLQTHGVR